MLKRNVFQLDQPYAYVDGVVVRGIGRQVGSVTQPT